MPMKKTRNLTSREIDDLERLYPDIANDELARMFGISVYTVKARATMHGWHKSAAFISWLRRRIAIENGSHGHLNAPATVAKRTKTLLKLYREEKERALAGYPQLTKRQVSTIPRQRLMQKNYLQRRGYVVNDAVRVAYYTPETRRSPRIENVPRDTCKGNIRAYYDFWPLPEKH